MDLDDLRLAHRQPGARGLIAAARSLGQALRGARHRPGGLLIVGTPDDEPWHLAAHLSEQARRIGRPELSPVLVRHRVPPAAPSHLAVDLRRLDLTGRGETILVVAPGSAPAPLLERVSDARHAGAVVLAIEAGDHDLAQLAHETLTVPATGIDQAGAFDTAQHLVTIAAGSATRTRRGGLHRNLDAALHQPDIRRQRGHESDDHADLHQ